VSNQFNIPTYEELVALSNAELMKRIREIENAINAASARGESTVWGIYVHKVYEEEQVKRVALARKKNNLKQ